IDAPNDSAPSHEKDSSSRKKWWPFSPRVFFSVITTVGLALLIIFVLAPGPLGLVWSYGGLDSLKDVRVSSVLIVDPHVPTILGSSGQAKSRDEDFEECRRTAVAFIKSRFVLNAALRDPKVSNCQLIKSQADPLDWLSKHLEVSAPADAPIIRISLR